MGVKGKEAVFNKLGQFKTVLVSLHQKELPGESLVDSPGVDCLDYCNTAPVLALVTMRW